MVRTLDASLTAALNNTTRIPAITLTIEDHVIHYGLYQNPGTTDAWNDACIASDNGIIRVQVTRGGSGFTSNFQVQRITDPTQASQWAAWSTLPGSAGLMFQDGGCAVSNSGGTLRAFAQRGTGGNNLWVWTSTNNGVSWTGPTTAITPAGGALLKGISSAGNNDVFFLYDVTGGEAMGCVFYSSGSWSALNNWTLPTISYGSGLAAIWTGSSYTIVYSDGYTLYSCIFNPTGSIWTASTVIAPATSTAIGHTSPRLALIDGIYTLTCIESDTGLLTGSVYSYPRLRQSLDLIHWSNGMILHDITSSYGAVTFKLPVPNSGNAGSRYYTVSVLSYQRLEQVGKPARVEVLIDNARGVYNNLVTGGSNYQPIGPNASMVLSEGYKTGTPPTVTDVVKVGVYHLEQIAFVRTPQENLLRLVGLDLSRNLDLVSRYQNSYINQTLSYLISEVCARAAFFSPVLPTTSQMNQLIPAFVLQAGQTYRHALDELCNVYGLEYVLDQNETLQFRELSSSDTSVWNYQPEIELVSFGNDDARTNHIIVSGKPPVGGLPGALTTAEAYDDTHLHLVGVERVLHYVDQKLTTVAQVAQKASFLLQQEMRTQTSYTIAVPLNPALQLLDVITIVDSAAPTGSGRSANCRILHLLVHYDAQHSVYEMQLTLEGL